MSILRRKERFVEPDQLVASACPKCGCRTIPGERYCPRCHARLSYHCPYCDAPEIDNTFVNCPNCRRPLTWDTNTRVTAKPVPNKSVFREQIATTNYKERMADEKSKKPSLLGFLVALALLALIVVVFVLVIQNM